MKKILVLGAGRSSSALINYLVERAADLQWFVTVGDVSLAAAQQRVGGAPHTAAVAFDIQRTAESEGLIQVADVVISLLPAALHPQVAALCLKLRKHLLTASYVSEEMKVMDSAAHSAGLLFLNECGLDPGIDHMSAMQVIEKIKREGGNITSFESFTGGLIAPETDPENPWRYKFTWNPRNVIVAGQGTAKYLQDKAYKYISYPQLFSRITPIAVPGVGEFEGYANRDSLKYVSAYGLDDCHTVLRGTLRYAGYCRAWNILVQLGCCDDTYVVEGLNAMSHRAWLSSFLPAGNVEEQLCQRFSLSPQSEELKRLRWIGLFSDEPVGLTQGTPAQVLEHIFAKKWMLNPGDKDFIVMWHRFRYELQGKQHEIQAWLTATGDDETNTAMAKTVGLPIAVATHLLLTDQLHARGVKIPVTADVYAPIMNGLNSLGIELKESHRQLD